MTSERRDLLITHLLLRGMIWTAMIVVVCGTTGCLAPAMIAPLAIQAGEMAGVGAINAAGHATGGNSHCDFANRNLTCAEWAQYMGNEKYQATCPNLPAPRQCPQ
jgi:hypothetical protein